MTINERKNFEHNVRLLVLDGKSDKEARKEALRMQNEIDDGDEVEGWAASDEI